MRVLRRLASIVVARRSSLSPSTPCFARARRQKQLSIVLCLAYPPLRPKNRTTLCERFCFFFWAKWCIESNSSCVAGCECAYPTRSSESSLSRRRVWIYSPPAKIPPLRQAREYSALLKIPPLRRPRVLRRLASIVVARRSSLSPSTPCFARARRQKQLSIVLCLAYPPLRPKNRTTLCERFCFFFWAKWCIESNSSCVAGCECAYPTRSSESSLSRRRVRIYSPPAKRPN